MKREVQGREQESARERGQADDFPVPRLGAQITFPI